MIDLSVAPHAPGSPPRHRRRPASQRGRLIAVFALNGAIFGSWAARVPDVSAHLQTDHALLGAALLCLSLGALLSMRVAARLCGRFGAGRLTVVGAGALSVAAVTPGLAQSVISLGVALFCFGIASGTLNVAMNSLGVELESRDRRPLLPYLHAASSFGGLGGALLGGLVAGALAPWVHLLGVGALGALLTAVVAPALGPGVGEPSAGDPPSTTPGPLRARRLRNPPEHRRARYAVVLLGVIAGCTAYGEGALSDWAALHLRTDLGAGAALAAAAYAGFSLTMGLGRLAGGLLLGRLGQTPMLVGGGLVAAAGMVVAALVPSAPLAVLGFAVVGAGLANMFPLALARAGALGGPSGVALATTIGYAGLLGGPPVIGVLSGQVGLASALTTIALLALVAVTVALVLAVGFRTEPVSSRLVLAWYRVAGAVRSGVPVAAVTSAVAWSVSGRVGTVARNHGRSLDHLVPPGMVPAPPAAHLEPYPGLDHRLH